MLDNPSFVFLMCSERSGSNLITKIFDAHPQVCGPSTAHLLAELLPQLYRYGDLHEETAWAGFVADVAELLDCKMSVWKRSFSMEELLDTVAIGNVWGLLSAIFANEAAMHGKSVIFVKENKCYKYGAFLATHCPNARYLYMVRDPRDMAASWKNCVLIRGGVVRAAKTWKQDQIGFLQLRGQLQTCRDVAALRYEDLIARPPEVLTACCRELGLSYDPAMLEFHNKDITVANAQRGIAWRNLSSPVLQNNAGKYRKSLTPEEVLYVESLCAEQMRSLGYDSTMTLLQASSLAELEHHLANLEPNEKPAYHTLPEKERQGLARFAAVLARLRNQACRVSFSA